MSSPLKRRLQGNSLTIGSWISLGHPAIAEILARAGFDWLVVDLEHSTISVAQAGELIRVIDLCGVVPLVRVTSNDGDQIKRMLDAGAHGILVPMVKSPEEAQRAVSATRYAPEGTRGVGLARAQLYGPGFGEYLERQRSDGPVVIVQIEHCDALDRLDEILTVPGVDGLIIGPYDLSCSMGLPGRFDEQGFRDVLGNILNAARRAGIPAGLHVVEPEPARLREVVAEGYRFVAYSVDVRMLDTSARLGLGALVAAGES